MTKLFKGTPRNHVPGKSVERLALGTEHDEIREQLRHLRASLSSIGAEDPRERRQDMDRVIAWLEQHIENHTRHEDNDLYPLIEKHAGKSVTAALRVEHRFIYRSFDDLRRLAAEPMPDGAEFVRTLDNLIGLFAAHFEAEEEVLFPLVDQLREKGISLDAA